MGPRQEQEQEVDARNNRSLGMPKGGEPSPEQLMMMLEQLQAQGHDLSQISPDLPALMRNVKKDKGQPTDDLPTEEITPEPGFVIKTQDKASETKVFINVCCSDKVPAPGNWSNGAIPEEVQKALESREGESSAADAEALRFPLSAGKPRHDVDKKGQACMTVDCILNADVVKQAAASRILKSFLIELCMGWVAQKASMDLDPKFKLPKMRYKGEVVEKQTIRVDRKPLVCEVKDLPDEPSFPLVTKKPKQPKPAAEPATGQAAATAGGSGGSGVASTSGRPLSELKPSQIYPQAQAPSRHALKHSVQFVGQPVEEMVVKVQLPPVEGPSQGPGGGVVPPQVELCGKSVYVSAPGCEDLHVQLPLNVAFGSDSSHARYDAAQGVLELRLRYLPLQLYLDQMRQEKPLSFGQLGLQTDGLLELD